MWDCKHREVNDKCRRRKTACYPGGKLCVLEGKFEFPFRTEPDELAKPAKKKKKK